MFIELRRGYSFKGVALYCLHDADRAKTADRVAFVEMRNVATSNPHVAWRIMAAKHYAQDELKRKAGVGLGGPKDGKPVGHMYISWGRDEAEAQNLSRDEMVRSATGALRAIGADTYPAIILAHTDTEHPHCHIICCFVGDDGRLKKNWKEKEKLSRFALQREIEVHGEPVVKLRERNWKHRDAGEKAPSAKKKARHLYELNKAAEQDPKVREFAKDHYAKLRALMRRRNGEVDRQGNILREGQQQRYTRHRERLHFCYEERARRIKAATVKAVTLEERRIRTSFQQPWKELLNNQEAERHEFRKNETTLLGRAYNILHYTDWKAVFLQQKQTGEKGPSIFSRAFNAISSSGHRQEALARRQQEEEGRLRRKQQQLEEVAKTQLTAELSRRLFANKAAYARKEAAMKGRQTTTQIKLNEDFQQLTRERNAELRAYRERVKLTKHERARIKAPRAIPRTPINLTTEANEAFGVRALDVRESAEESTGRAPTAKPKRTRKRKDPSERSNRRRTKTTESAPLRLSDQAAQQDDEWLEPRVSRFNRRSEYNKDHER